jgi:hypothetical protein
MQQVFVNFLMLWVAALHTKMMFSITGCGEEFSSICAVKLENGALVH